ncbi:MAG TPA: hypothetical protein VGO67_05450 [Verrucomicrobiae bacterium]|jgi:hypothetical protein
MISLPENLTVLNIHQFRALYQAALNDCMDDPHSNSLVRAHDKCMNRYPALQKEFYRRQALGGDNGVGKQAVIDNAAREQIKASTARMNAATTLGFGADETDADTDDVIKAAGDLQTPNYKAAYARMVDNIAWRRQVSRSAADSIVRNRHPLLSLRSDNQTSPADGSGLNKSKTGLNAFTPAGCEPIAN